jgi:hypothetical protein
MSFFLQKRTGSQNRSCLWSGYQWDRGGYKERVRRVNIVEYYALIYINGK